MADLEAVRTVSNLHKERVQLVLALKIHVFIQRRVGREVDGEDHVFQKKKEKKLRRCFFTEGGKLTPTSKPAASVLRSLLCRHQRRRRDTEPSPQRSVPGPA